MEFVGALRLSVDGVGRLVQAACYGQNPAGRRDLTIALRHRLFPLNRHLHAPPLLVSVDEPLPTIARAPEATPLEYRRNYCLHKAAGLRLTLIQAHGEGRVYQPLATGHVHGAHRPRPPSKQI